MVVSDAERATQLYVMASNFRHAAAETAQPRYRARLLNVARDLEREAAKLEDHFAAGPEDPSRTR